MTFPRVFLLPAILLAVLLAACDSTAQTLPRLDDPKEIIEEALRTTAELEFVHARLEAGTDAAGQSQSYTIDGDLNLAQREFHANMDLAGLAAWSNVPRSCSSAPTCSRAPRILAWALFATIAGSAFRSMRAAIRGTAFRPRRRSPSRSRDCWPTRGSPRTSSAWRPVAIGSATTSRSTVDPEVTWRAVNGALVGAPPGGELGPVDPSVPEITFDVLVDEATRRLMSLSTSVALQGQSFDLSATLSDHDVKFDLVPPAPEQVVEYRTSSAPLRPQWLPAGSSTRLGAS